MITHVVMMQTLQITGSQTGWKVLWRYIKSVWTPTDCNKWAATYNNTIDLQEYTDGITAWHHQIYGWCKGPYDHHYLSQAKVVVDLGGLQAPKGLFPGCLLEASLGRYSGNFHPGGDPSASLGHAVKIYSWPGNVLGSGWWEECAMLPSATASRV